MFPYNAPKDDNRLRGNSGQIWGRAPTLEFRDQEVEPSMAEYLRQWGSLELLQLLTSVKLLCASHGAHHYLHYLI